MSISSFTYAGGRIDITPSGPMRLAGYGIDRPRSISVQGRLEANAIVLQHDGAKVVLVQLDVISVGAAVRERILRRLADRLDDQELLLVASHTHYAPNIDSQAPGLGIVDPQYVEFVAEQTAGLVERVLSAQLRPAYLHRAESVASHAINRRCWCWRPAWGFPPIRRVIGLHPNPCGPKDETVRVFVLSADPEGRSCEAVFWNYACHPVTTSPMLALSADYPGVVRDAFRDVFRDRAGADIPVVFLPGFSGDVRPNRVDRFPRSPFYFLHRVVNGPVFGAFNESLSRQWTESLAVVAAQAIRGPLQPCNVGPIVCRRQSNPLSDILDGADDARRLSLHLVRLSDTLVIVGLSAEPVIEYAPQIRSLFPDQTVICVGYLDAVYGYLPTSEMLHEGGLEIASPGYGLQNARYRTDVSRRILDRIRSLQTSVREDVSINSAR